MEITIDQESFTPGSTTDRYLNIAEVEFFNAGVKIDRSFFKVSAISAFYYSYNGVTYSASYANDNDKGSVYISDLLTNPNPKLTITAAGVLFDEIVVTISEKPETTNYRIVGAELKISKQINPNNVRTHL